MDLNVIKAELDKGTALVKIIKDLGIKEPTPLVAAKLVQEFGEDIRKKFAGRQTNNFKMQHNLIFGNLKRMITKLDYTKNVNLIENIRKEARELLMLLEVKTANIKLDS